MNTSEYAAQITNWIEAQPENLTVEITSLDSVTVFEIASINRCCHQNNPDVPWGVWQLDPTGEPYEHTTHVPYCGGCGFDASDNSFLSDPVIIDHDNPQDWKHEASLAVEGLLAQRNAWRAQQRSKATSFLEHKIDARIADGVELPTDAESGTESWSTELYDWAIWREGETVFGWAGWGDESGIEDVTFEHSLLDSE